MLSINRYRILFFFTLFFAPNVIDYLGIAQNGYYSVLMVVSVFFAYRFRQTIDKNLVLLIIFTILYGIFKIYTDTGEGTRAIVLCAMAPGVLFAAYPKIKSYNKNNLCLWKNLMLMLLIFYLIETGMAIYERITWSLVFGWANTHSIGIDVAMTEFRSTALLGHPLANALIVSSLMSFFLVSPIKTKYKYTLWFLGFVAVLCFNARGATIGNITIFSLYLMRTFFFNKRMSSKAKFRLFLLILCLCCLGGYLLMNGYIGGRLIEGDLNDSSSQVRIDIWSVFSKYNLNTFLIGINSHDLGMVMYSLGLYATENYWLDWIFRLGICFLVPYICLYACVIRHEYRTYAKFDILITLVTFLGVSSTNNSLSSSILPTFIFILCIRIFNKGTIAYLLPQKLLDKKQLI